MTATPRTATGRALLAEMQWPEHNLTTRTTPRILRTRILAIEAEAAALDVERPAYYPPGTPDVVSVIAAERRRILDALPHEEWGSEVWWATLNGPEVRVRAIVEGVHDRSAVGTAARRAILAAHAAPEEG